jgi:hypothetical protein
MSYESVKLQSENVPWEKYISETEEQDRLDPATDITNAHGDPYHSMCWWKGRDKHRIGAPAIKISYYGEFLGEMWFENDRLHRVDGPAIIQPWCLSWYLHGQPIDNFDPDDFRAKSKKQALRKLDSKPRPYSRQLWLELIERKFPAC